MKTMKQLAAIVAVAALTGCNPGSSPTGQEPPDNPVATLNKESASGPSPAAAAASKTGFITTTEQKLRDFDAKIEELAKKSEGYKDDAKAQAEQVLSALRGQRTKLNEQFESLKQANAEAWKDLKAGFESALSEFERAYENAKPKFS